MTRLPQFLSAGAALGATIVTTLLFGGMLSSARAADSVILPHPALDESVPSDARTQSVVFAGGCFWGVQGVFEHVKGVVSATSGYAGGEATTATYEQVSDGDTGHAEAVRVVYDPTQISFGKLLEVFFSVVHDPTELDRQGPDVGSQYRSAIFYTNADQQRVARTYIEQLTTAETFARPIVTQVNALKGFFPAEEYHQDYLIHHPDQPYIVYNDLPKIAALSRRFPDLYREKPVEWHPEAAAVSSR